MTQYNFKNLDYEDDVIECLQLCERRPSKCDAVLKCDDGQIYLSRISLAIWSEFWRNLFCDIDNGLKTVILLPGFDKESVLEAIVFLRNGEITTDYCPRSVQKVIYYILALIPDMDILSFEIERIFEESEDNVDSDDNLDQNIDVHWPAAAGEGPIISVTGPAPFEDMKLISSPQSQDLTPSSTVTHQNKVDQISESDKNNGKGPIISIIKPISSPSLKI